MSWFRFRDKESSTMGVLLLERSCDLYGKTRSPFLSIPGRDGSVFISEAREDISMVLKCAVLCDDDTDLQLTAHDLSAWLCGDGELVFWDSPDFSRRACVVSVSGFEGFGTWGEFEITFRCAPFARGSETTIGLNQSVTFQGNAPCRGKWAFSLPAGSDVGIIIASCSSGNMTLQGDFREGDAFVIDTENGAVWCNGEVHNELLQVGSRFLAVLPDVTFLHVVGRTEVTSHSLEGTYTYRPRWY